MVKLKEFIVCAVEALWETVTLDGQVLSLVGAHVCIFVGEMASSATDPVAFVFQGFGAVLYIMV